MNPKITFQKTYFFAETNEEVTVYISDTSKEFSFCIALNSKGEDLRWSKFYEGIYQLQSETHPDIFYMYLTAYWEGEEGKSIPVEQPIMVKASI